MPFGLVNFSLSDVFLTGVPFSAEAVMASGTIARINRTGGFGFIRQDGSSRDQDLFFHRSALLNVTFEELRENQPVTFTPGQGPKGARAEGVHVTDA